MLYRIRRFFDTHLGVASTDQDPAAPLPGVCNSGYASCNIARPGR